MSSTCLAVLQGVGVATGPRRHADSRLAVVLLVEAVGAIVFLLQFSCSLLLYFPWLYRFLSGLSVLHGPLVLVHSKNI